MYSWLFIIKKKKDADWDILKNILESPNFIKYIKLKGKDFSWWYKSLTSKLIKDYIYSYNEEKVNLF